MTDLLIATGLNLSFWLGMGLLVRGRPPREGADRVLAAAVAGFAVIVLSLEVLGSAGQISRQTVGAICLLTGVAGAVRGFKASRAVASAVFRTQEWSIPKPLGRTWPAVAAAVFASWAALQHLLVGLVFPVQPVSDAPIYHLYFAARWWQSGRLDLVPTPFGEEAAAYFPANGDLWLTWLLATGAGPFVKVGQWPFLVVGAIALFGIARKCGMPRPAALFPAALWVGLPIVLTQSSVANVDLIWTAFCFGAVHFLVRWFGEPGPGVRGSLTFFALACGIVAGTKAVGAVFVSLLLVPVLGALAWRRVRVGWLTGLVVAVLVPSAYWYGRNIWLTGNPVYPLQLSTLGTVVGEGWYTRSAMQATTYHVPVGEWRVLVGQLGLGAGAIGAALALAGIASGWLHGFRASLDRASRGGLAMCATLAVAYVVIYWCVLPYNTQVRFLSAAFGLALVPLSAVAAGRTPVQAALALLLGWQLVAARHGGTSTLLPLLDNPLAPGQPWLVASLPASILGAAVMLDRARRARWGGAGAVVVSGCVLAAWPAARWLSEHPLLRFYPRGGFADRLFPGWEILEAAVPPGGSRIAYAGTNLPYYLLGDGLENHVEYVNVNRARDWRPHDYHRARREAPGSGLANDPWPQWYRAEADFDAWLENLGQRRIAFLFVARENRHGRLEHGGARLPPFPIEKTWADTHPDRFEDLGPYRYDAGTIPWVRVYRVISAE